MRTDARDAHVGSRGAPNAVEPTGYWKCAACRIRVSSAELATDLIPGSACPSCGEPLQAVEDLAEVRGFRSPGLREARTPRAVITRVAQIMARRDAARAQTKRDGARLVARGR